MPTPFAVGRRWYVDRAGPNEKERRRARFWFVILGPGNNCNNKPSKCHKSCRIDVHPDDLTAEVPGYASHGQVHTYSHEHLKKYARLEPES